MFQKSREKIKPPWFNWELNPCCQFRRPTLYLSYAESQMALPLHLSNVHETGWDLTVPKPREDAQECLQKKLLLKSKHFSHLAVIFFRLQQNVTSQQTQAWILLPLVRVYV